MPVLGSSSSITARLLVTTVTLAPAQVARELERGGADVDHQRLAVGDERGGGAADAVLLGEALDGDLLERRLLALADGAAVDALQPALERELREVAAHGHLRDVEALRQLDHAGGLSAADGVEDQLSALRCEHRAPAARDDSGATAACSDLFEPATRDGDPIAERAGLEGQTGRSSGARLRSTAFRSGDRPCLTRAPGPS